MSEPVLELKEVTLRRGRFSLEGVNLSLAGGEILALLGRTGAGKTLLLESAAGFCAPSGGQVLFRGRRCAASGCTGAISGTCIRNTACSRI